MSKLSCAGFVVLTKNKHKVVLVRTPKGVYGFPKGKLEKDEEMYDAALRELKEETGLIKDNLELANPSIYVDELSHGGKPAIRLFMAYIDNNYDVKKLEPIDKEELASCELVSIEQALLILQDKRKIVLNEMLRLT